MRILLPPSEAKAPGGRGAPLALGDGVLDQARRTVLTAVERLCRHPVEAARLLALPAGSAEADVAMNREIGRAATMPALRRYRGVVYDGLAADSLDPAALRRAGSTVLIFSGLLGVSRGREPVPPYRVPAGAVLPGLGGLAAFWRPVLTELLPALLGRGLVIDLRSTDYAAMWRPDERTVPVRILSERPGGGLAVISYPSKLGKGRLARALLDAADQPVRTRADVLDAWARAGGRDGNVRPDGGLELLT